MARGKKAEVEVRGLPIDVKGCHEELEAALRFRTLEHNEAAKEAKKHKLEIGRTDARIEALLKRIDKINRGETLPFEQPASKATKAEDDIPDLSDGIPDHEGAAG